MKAGAELLEDDDEGEETPAKVSKPAVDDSFEDENDDLGLGDDDDETVSDDTDESGEDEDKAAAKPKTSKPAAEEEDDDDEFDFEDDEFE